ncbi:MAG: response regulator [Candidatus Nitrosopolaris sp.]|jgi:two-component SAPR family response regulator
MNAHRRAEDLLYRTVAIKDKQRFCKRILIVDDDEDVTITFKAGIEDSNNNTDANKRIEVFTSNDPIVALSEFKPNFYDLLLVYINMPHMNGFELSEKILDIDIDVKICFMSSGKINREGLREIYPTKQEGCFVRKPISMDYLVKRIRSEVDQAFDDEIILIVGIYGVLTYFQSQQSYKFVWSMVANQVWVLEKMLAFLT